MEETIQMRLEPEALRYDAPGTKLMKFLVWMWSILGIIVVDSRDIKLPPKRVLDRIHRMLFMLLYGILLSMLFVMGANIILNFYHSAPCLHPVSYNCSLEAVSLLMTSSTEGQLQQQQQNTLGKQISRNIFYFLSYFASEFKILGNAASLLHAYFAALLLCALAGYLNGAKIDNDYRTLNFVMKTQKYIDRFDETRKSLIEAMKNLNIRHKAPCAARQSNVTNAVACRNLEHFLPFVRCSTWRDYCLFLHPFIYASFFFSIVACVLDHIFHFKHLVNETHAACVAKAFLTGSEPIHQNQNQNCHDKFLSIETTIATAIWPLVVAFWPSFYYWTHLEHIVWLTEIKQQLILCVHILKLKRSCPQLMKYRERHYHKLIESIYKKYNVDIKNRQAIRELCSEYGGLNNYLNFVRLSRFTGLRRQQVFDLIAIELIPVHKTCIRAAYLNWQLYRNDARRTNVVNNDTIRDTFVLCVLYIFAISCAQFRVAPNITGMYMIVTNIFIYLSIFFVLTIVTNAKLNTVLSNINIFLCHINQFEDYGDILDIEHREIKEIGPDDHCYKLFGYRINFLTTGTIHTFFTNPILLLLIQFLGFCYEASRSRFMTTCRDTIELV